MTNILILSAGTRVKIIQYFMQTLNGNGKVVAADCSELAPSLYFADKYRIVPRMTDDNYLETVLNICRKDNITGVLSLIDPELELLAMNRDKFLEVGSQVIVSDLQAVKCAFDKKVMYDFCKRNSINVVPTYISIEEVKVALNEGEAQFPLFVKPACGSCSMNISKANDFEELEFLYKKTPNPIIQKFMTGTEIGADVYIDSISREVVSIFTKRKILMRAGETDKAVSFKNEKLNCFIEDLVKKFGFSWNIDIDIFEENGTYFLSEINPRFGGGYPHAYECGVNFMKKIINNIEGNSNKKQMDYSENVYMMKYLECLFKN